MAKKPSSERWKDRMKKIARIVVPITISLFLILTGFGGGAALASEGIADLLPYGEQSVPEASGQAEINLSEDGLSGQMELEVSGLTGETTYYVNILDQDGAFYAIGFLLPKSPIKIIPQMTLFTSLTTMDSDRHIPHAIDYLHP
jgi:hypothetical protein